MRLIRLATRSAVGFVWSQKGSFFAAASSHGIQFGTQPALPGTQVGLVGGPPRSLLRKRANAGAVSERRCSGPKTQGGAGRTGGQKTSPLPVCGPRGAERLGTALSVFLGAAARRGFDGGGL